MTMFRLMSSACLLAASMLGSAHADGNCYSIYDPKNVLVFQSTYSPVDESKPFTDTVGKALPGYFMVVSSPSRCPDVAVGDAASRLGLANVVDPSASALFNHASNMVPASLPGVAAADGSPGTGAARRGVRRTARGVAKTQ